MSNYKYLIRLVFCNILISLMTVLGLNAQVSIQLEIDSLSPHFGSVRLSGLSDETLSKLTRLGQKDWKQYYTVHLADANGEAQSEQSMLGKYLIDDKHVIFQPRFPLIKGRKYLVQFNFEEAYRQLITVPTGTVLQPTQLLAYYPSSKVVPENWLKLYLYFSAPMRKGEALAHIHCYDGTDTEIKTLFLDMGEELWDKAGKRLTLWLDPGRIKRYLHPNLQQGKPLEAGTALRILIDENWKDANGRKLDKPMKIIYQIVEADRQKPKTEQWDLIYPESAQAPVEIDFYESMDHALLNSRIVILNEAGQMVDGQIKLQEQESRWVFYPNKAWLPGAYTLRISTRLEDLAGNNLRRVFDRDVEAHKEQSQDVPVYLDFPFSIPEN